MMKFQVTLIFIFTGIITTNDAFVSSDFKNVFHHINDRILETVDEVFITLRIDDNFTKSENIADSLLLKNFMQNISDKNYKKYEEIHNLSKITIDCNKTAYFIFIINEMIEEFLMQEGKTLKPLVSVKYYKNKLVNSASNTSNLITEKNVTFDLVKLKKEFNLKVEKGMIADIVYKLLFANPKKPLKSPGLDLNVWEFNTTTSSLETRRVFDGRPTSVMQFPFMASVHIEGRFCCAGSIIRKEFVITAASCLSQFHTAQRIPHLALEVRVASDYASQGGELVPVEEMYFHPHFNHESLNNNLVILKLKTRLKFNGRMRKIMFDTNAYKMPENAKNILILGWGSINKKKEHPVDTTPLSFAFVDVYNLHECKNVYSSFYVKNKNFCTGYVSKGSGACKNDIGGPAVLGSTLAGVASHGSPRCGRPDAPTVFTKLGYYADWISSIFDMIPETNNDIEPKSTFVSKPRNLMMDTESTEKEDHITNEIQSLAELIGELQVVKHINNTLAEILREKQTEDPDSNDKTERDEQSSEEEDNDIMNVANVVLKSLTQNSETTTPENVAIPDASEYESTRETPVVNSIESEETTKQLNVYVDLDKQFISGHLDAKTSPTYTSLATNSDEFTLPDEWPRTRFDNELLKEMTISNDLYSHDNNNAKSDNNNELVETTANYEELETSSVPIASTAEQGELLDIVFLKNTRLAQLSMKGRTSKGRMETSLPRDLPLIYYESSSKRKT